MLQTPSESPESIMAAVLQRTLTQKSGLSRAFPPFTSSFFTSSVASSASTLDVPTPTGPSRSTIWLNILWFSSLVLSLSSASIGILVKQWLNEFESGLSGDSDSEQVAKLRQYRLSNLKNCRVGTIVNAIPVLLQAALALFFAGLLVLLWDLNHSVAGVTAAFILATGLFIIGTTVAPLIMPRCAYLSSQSLAIYAIWQHSNKAVSSAYQAYKGYREVGYRHISYDHMLTDSSTTEQSSSDEWSLVSALNTLSDWMGT